MQIREAKKNSFVLKKKSLLFGDMQKMIGRILACRQGWCGPKRPDKRLIFAGFLLVFGFISANSPLIESGNRVEIAKQRTLTWFELNQENLEGSSALFLSYFQRTFSISISSALQKTVKERIATLPADQPVIRGFLRLCESPVPFQGEDLNRIEGVNHLTLTGLYCDLISLSPGFLEELFQQSNENDYGLTHAAWAWAMVKEKGCLDEISTSIRHSVELNLSQRLTELIEATLNPTDISIEAMVMLAQIKGPGSIQQEWLDELLASQLKDGSWAEKPGMAGNDHSTMLALWLFLLLEKG